MTINLVRGTSTTAEAMRVQPSCNSSTTGAGAGEVSSTYPLLSASVNELSDQELIDEVGKLNDEIDQLQNSAVAPTIVQDTGGSFPWEQRRGLDQHMCSFSEHIMGLCVV